MEGKAKEGKNRGTELAETLSVLSFNAWKICSSHLQLLFSSVDINALKKRDHGIGTETSVK